MARERARIYAPLLRDHGLPALQVEYKLRRFVNDYLQPPKVTRKEPNWPSTALPRSARTLSTCTPPTPTS